ncbi:MAG: hypothetical protein HFF39_01040 [Lawsonibacter sp.]|nr:hypothetical protein [Lawsonibacter sp.]
MSRTVRACLPLCLLLLLAACAPAQSPPPVSASVPPAVSSPAEPDRSPPESSPVQEPEEPETPEEPKYDFSAPVPVNDPVENSYFEDAAFIGDSRTDGFLLYSGIGCGENLTSNGLSIFRLAEKKVLKIDGQSYTLLEALALKQYGKVYLSLGINELGYYNDKGFYQAYCDAIDAIRAAQPNAVIYIQGLIPINEEKVLASGGKDYFKNDHLLIYNDLMKQAAQEKQVAFLNLNPYFADEDGALPEDASSDGIHLKSAYCKLWLEYLQTHTVEFETLYPDGPEGEIQPEEESAS